MSSSPQLSFGIEIEAIVAFHESKLQEHLSLHFPTATIVKSLDSAQTTGLRQIVYPQLPYNSWALANAEKNNMTVKPTIHHEVGPVRAYRDEPLHIVKELLSSTSCAKDINIHNPEDHSKPTDYSKWILTSDHSLTSLDPIAKQTALASKVTAATEAANWDTYGIELVSPPFISITQAQEQISSIVNTINTPNTTFLTTNNSCGLHVHIGLPSGECLPLKALQHLAYMLIVYEDEISRLHPHHRRQRSKEIYTNRENLYAEAPEPVPRTILDHLTGAPVTKNFTPTYDSLAKIRNSLLTEVSAAVNPLDSLQFRMGKSRGRIVNFAYINRKSGPCTIGFRQHAASTDAVEITHWVDFCIKLVQLALRYANEDGKCKVSDWDNRIDIEDSFEEMGLCGERRDYYRGKMEEYRVGDTEPIPYWQEEEVYVCEEEDEMVDSAGEDCFS
ncbi:hypothetical protein EJ08DRAFT_655460 [Tothia fuscella]|uniref:Amidoligase enzyme protein n=1 Tax=Tothia fuscella TaxID=1048955 RepID=A0A9P4P3C0_9PEZI|nr:hypothetical protein EJ08DRAFT_655460 [Tothia fuscella]